MNQPELPFTGDQLRDRGMMMAEEHANEISEAWSELCYKLLLQYASTVREFQCEDFRAWCKGKLPDPPSLRAYGSVVRQAAVNRVIETLGTAKVSNPKAHRANAAVWRLVF